MPKRAPIGAAWRILSKGASRCLPKGATSPRHFSFGFALTVWPTNTENV
jgi:hypothetical protein